MQVKRINPILSSAFLPDLFQGIIFHKKEDSDDSTSIYVTRASKMTTSSNNDYIILICNKSNKRKGFYKDFVVKSIQTRNLPAYFFSCPGIVWHPDKIGYDLVVQSIDRKIEYTTYETPEGDLEILLFHDHRRKDLSGKVSINQYPSKNNILAALETFKCVINTKLPQEDIIQDSYTLL